MNPQLWAVAVAGVVVLAAAVLEVYTLPTTVVMCANGKALYVNYGYASARKLEGQLADARSGLGATATA